MKHDRAAPLGIPTTYKNASEAEESPSSRTWGKANAAEKWLLKKLLQGAGYPPVSVVLWDGSEIYKPQSPPMGRIILDDRSALYKLLGHPDLEFGELYSSGRLRIEGNLVKVLEVINRALLMGRGRFWSDLRSRLYLLRRNTLSRARGNIYHHYDIGNDFYRLWLDEQMLYTCAYFPSRTATLEEAQIAKMDHVCRKLRLQPGEEIVEAGCGWGALALHMAKYYGVKVKAYNISREQVAYARERARREGMEERVEYIEGDYRAIRGEYDAFVSVGMLEHVGLQQYRDLGAIMDRSLKPWGRGLIHSIGRNRPAPMNDWIEKRIFPGAYPPSLMEMAPLFEPWDFSILDVENLRLHYALTLHHWLERYEKSIDRVREMFDEAFVRAWRFYLAGSEATFTTGGLQLFQVVFTRFDSNEIPWTRDFLYASDRV